LRPLPTHGTRCYDAIMFFKQKKKNRVLVIGLDGVPKELVERLAEQGVMPFLGTLFRFGAVHRMASALPEVSIVNWTSFATGANPGAHGIFGFTDLQRDSYTLTFPAFADVKTDTLWDELGHAGKRSLVINQPACYPARGIPGALVSGFVAVDLKRAVAPGEHCAALERMGYKIDVDTQRCAGNPDVLFEELDACLESRRQAADHFFALEDWDFAEVVITGTDRLQHFLWTSCAGDGPEQEGAMRYYGNCDGLIRRLVERFFGKDDPEHLFLLSDHGFAQVEQEFNLNAWLRREGYLEFTKEPPESYADIASGARAFAMDPGRVYIHRKGRYPKGTVEDDGPLGDIQVKLEGLEHNGRRVFDRVWRRDELYTGSETCHGPDLVCTPRPGIDVKGAIKRNEIWTDSRFTGMHKWDNAFFWSRATLGELCISDLRAICARPLLA